MEYNLDQTKEVLHDYYAIKLPDDVLEIIVSNEKLQDEILHNSISDTCAREFLIDAVCRHLGISVQEQNMFGETGYHGWPLNGDPKTYKEAFYKQLEEKLQNIGGSFSP